MREPSEERGCVGKTRLGRGYREYADRLSYEHGKQYAVYACPHCGNYHLTTKIDKAHRYATALYVTKEGER